MTRHPLDHPQGNARVTYQFVKKQPAYTKKTKRLSSEALAVLQTLQQAPEPDELIFTALYHFFKDVIEIKSVKSQTIR